MNSFAHKLSWFFVPLMLVSAGFAAVYSIFNWTLVTGSGVVPLDADVAEFWLPVLLAVALVTGFVQPRLHRFQLNEKQNIPFLYFVLAVAAIAVPAIAAQSYLRVTAGGLTHVANAAAIPATGGTRFYMTGKLCLDRRRALPHADVSVLGDRNETLSIELYAAVPLCGEPSLAPVWIGVTYEDTIDNELPDAQKEAAYRAFVKRSQKAFDAEDTGAYTYLERLGPSAERSGFAKALAQAHLHIAGPVFLVPHREPFATRGDARLVLAGVAFAVAALLWLVLVYVTPLKPPAVVEPPEKHPFRALFVPTQESWGAPLLLDLNIAVYLAMVLAGLGVLAFQTDDLMSWGANFGPALHGWGWLRLASATFVHGGLMHIAGNIYGLVFATALLAPAASNARLVVLYLVTGIGGSLASVFMHPAEVSVGASGAIFGLCGVLISLLVLRDPRMAGRTGPVLINVAIFVVLNLVYGAATPGIDNAAHVGGFLTGLVAGAAVWLLDRGQPANA